MVDKSLVFEKLLLAGFGPYQQATEFTFQPGINLFIAPNESGKSTMAAGLAAAIFGLVHRQGGDDSLSRYRNWAGPSSCRAELTFSLAGQAYRISRNFDNHDICFACLDKKGEVSQILVSGQHNPAATRPLLLYEEKLAEIFKISSRELFREIFYVQQPLPEYKELSEDVRHLLTGAASSSFQAGLDRLRQALAQLTRFLGPNQRAISSRNLLREGRLERLDRRIGQLTENLRLGRATADEYQEVQEKLALANQALAGTKKLLEQETAAVAAWQDWQRLGSEYKEAAKKRAGLEEGWQQLEQLARERSAGQEKLAADYPSWPLGTDLDQTRAGLLELIRLKGEISQLRADRRQLEDELARNKAAQTELTGQLGQNWLLPDPDPVGTAADLASQAGAFLQNWQEHKKQAQRLHDDYSLLAKAGAEELELLHNYSLKKENLVQAARQADIDYESARASLADLRRRQAELATANQDISSLDRTVPAAALARARLDQAEERLVKEELVASRQKNSILLACLFCLPAAVLLYLLLAASRSWPGLALAVLAGLGLAAGLYFLAGWKRIKASRKIRGQLAGLCEEKAGLDLQLGPFAPAGPVELVRLSERMNNYFRQLDQLAGQEEELASLDLAALAEKTSLKGRELARFTGLTDNYLARYPDLDQALANWQALRADQRALAENLQAQAANQALVRLFGLAEPAGEKAAARLAQALLDLPQGWWEELMARAEKVASWQLALSDLARAADKTDLLLASSRARLSRLENDAAGLAADLEYCLAAWQGDPQLALAACQARQELLRKDRELASQKEALFSAYRLADEAEMAGRLGLARDEALLALRLWQTLIEKNPALPAPDEAGDFLLVQQRLAEQKETVARLENQQQNQTRERDQLLLDLARLEGQEPLNIAVAELDLAELVRQKAELDLRADALELAHKELAAATTEFSHTYKERLGRQASLYLEQIGQAEKRQVFFDDQLEIKVRQGQQEVSLPSLSKGARDQLYLAVRFAIADLLASDLSLPLLLDDPLQSSDAGRRSRIQAILQGQAKKRQIFIFSHNRADYGDWGKNIVIKSH